MNQIIEKSDRIPFWSRMKSQWTNGNKTLFFSILTNLITCIFILLMLGFGGTPVSAKLLAFLVACFVAVTLLFILLFEKEWLLAKTIDRNASLEENNRILHINEEVREKNLVQCEIELEQLRNEIHSEEYKIAKHSFKVVNSYREVAMILNKIKDLSDYYIKSKNELKIKFESQLFKNTSDYTKANSYLSNEVRKRMRDICNEIADYIVSINPNDSIEVVASVFIANGLKNGLPKITNFCSECSGKTEYTNALKVQGRKYDVSENTDFDEICLKLTNREKGLFFCDNDLRNRTTYRDSNHIYLNKKKGYHYRKGKTEFVLSYKSLISSAIYDVKDTSEEVDKISGFLSISSDSYGCFNRGDTLMLQLIASQLHTFCFNFN